MKKNSRIKTLLIILGIAILFSWIFPGKIAAFPDQASGNAYGITSFEIFIQYAASNFQLPIYLLIIGGLYGVIKNNDAYKNVVINTREKFKNKTIIYPIMVTVFFTILMSVTNFGYAFLIFVPFIVDVLKELGYKKTHILGIILSIFAISYMGNTTGTMVVNDIYGQVQTLDKLTNIYIRLGLLVIGILLQLLFIFKALEPGKEKVSKKLVSDDPNKSTKPLIAMFVVAFIVLLLSTIPWQSVLKINYFEDLIKQASLKEKTPLWFEFIGINVKPFERWAIAEFMTIAFIMALLPLIKSKFKLDEVIENFGEGMKAALKPAFLIFILYGITFVALFGLFMGNILDKIAYTGGYNNFKLYIDFLVNNLFVQDPSIVTQLVVPYYVTNFAKMAGKFTLISQVVLGFFMLILPTSPLLLIMSSKEDVTYKDYLVDNKILLYGGIFVVLVCLILI